MGTEGLPRRLGWSRPTRRACIWGNMLGLDLQLTPSLKRFRDTYAQVFILLPQLRNIGPSPVNIKLTLEFPVSQNESYLLYVFANASEELISCQTDYSNIDPRGVRVPPTDHHFYSNLWTSHVSANIILTHFILFKKHTNSCKHWILP